MKYIKLFESYNSIDDVEDIILKYIDDEQCEIIDNTNFKHFNFKNRDSFREAVIKLNNSNTKNWFTNQDYINTIFSYSDKIEQLLINLTYDINIVSNKREEIYYDKDNNWLFYDNKFDNNFLCSYFNYWSKLENIFVMDNAEIQCLTIHWLDIKLNKPVDCLWISLSSIPPSN